MDTLAQHADPAAACADNCAEIYARIQGIPEHSVSLMTRASHGRALRIGAYLFYAAGDWLIGIGYPLQGTPSVEDFDRALDKAISQTGATDCRIVACELPARLAGHLTKQDAYYILPLERPLPGRLVNIVNKASQSLRIETGTTFTPQHRRLWGEFMGFAGLPSNVQALYASVEELLSSPDCEISLLNAYNAEGFLTACLVVDTAQPGFDTYLLGAHSRQHPVPHASDVLFARMIAEARQRSKAFLHLGLGVNQGIARFKRKWGGFPALPYLEAQWKEQKRSASVNVILHSIEASLDTTLSEQEHREHDFAQRPFRMLWRLDKDGRTSWIGGTAHFFCKSFERSFKQLYKNIDTVLFEGHLDDASLETISLAGKQPPAPEACLYDLLSQEERHRLERMVRGPEGPLFRFLNAEAENKADVRWYLRRTQHWYAFFALWCAFLERRGWRYSVDLEAWSLAHSLGKHVLAMEDIEEQLEALRAVPVQRAVNHLRNCALWPAYLRANARAYLAGDLMGLMGTSTEFPTRTGHIIGARDQRFRERMVPYLEEGRALALVGSAHLLNLRSMLEEDGFTVTPQNRSLWGRIRNYG